MPTVVIPAYNEAQGIERTLRAVLAQEIANLTVIVVPNACVDDTAARARTFEPRVIVVETATPGKPNAMNLAEETLRARGLDSFPRLFLDGDIELEAGALAAMLARCVGSTPKIVAAKPRFDVSRCSLFVRLFYQASVFNPWHSAGAPNGSGTFMVNASGRALWGTFPSIISDDSFVERHFAPTAQETVHEAHSIVRVPRTLAGLRAIAARKRLGTQELDGLLPARADGRDTRGTARIMLRKMLPRPHLWPALCAFLWVKTLERLDRKSAAQKQGQARWQQDRSSRD